MSKANIETGTSDIGENRCVSDCTQRSKSISVGVKIDNVSEVKNFIDTIQNIRVQSHREHIVALEREDIIICSVSSMLSIRLFEVRKC